MGSVADTAAIRMGKLAANVKNFKEAWGEFLNQSKVVNDVVSGAALTFEKFADKRLTIWEKLMYSGKEYQKLQSWFIGQENAKNPQNPQTGTTTPVQEKAIETITSLNEKLKEYKDELALVDISDKATTENLLVKINRTEAYIKKLGELSGAINMVAINQLKIPEMIPTTIKTKTGFSSKIPGKLAGGPNSNPANNGVGSVADLIAGVDSDQAMIKMEPPPRVKLPPTPPRDPVSQHGDESYSH